MRFEKKYLYWGLTAFAVVCGVLAHGRKPQRALVKRQARFQVAYVQVRVVEGKTHGPYPSFALSIM